MYLLQCIHAMTLNLLLGLYTHTIEVNLYCYIANAKTKRNWLIRGHVALDKCNVSLGKQVKNCCPATNIKKTKWRLETRIFKSCVEIK